MSDLKLQSAWIAAMVLGVGSSFHGQRAYGQAAAATVVEAEAVPGKNAAIYRDKRASGGKSVVAMFAHADKTLRDVVHGKSPVLPGGDYLVTAYIEVVPVSVQHMLTIHFTAGTATRQVGVAHLAPSGYVAIPLHVLHTGGPMALSIDGWTDSTFSGMRVGQSAEEKSYATAKPKPQEFKDARPDAAVDNLDIEEVHDIAALKFDDTRIVVDRFEITPLRLSSALVTKVDADKVHYLPGETVNATCNVQASSADAAGSYKLTAELITEADQIKPVFEKEVKLESGETTPVAFSFKLDDTTEFGHELRCSLTKDGKIVHSCSQVFGVSKNVYRVGITGFAGPQDRSHYTEKDADADMLANKKAYANYFECFAWQPSDFSDMTPKTESFFSGQTQYHGSISGFKNLLKLAHKYGIKGITYGKNSAGGIEGAKIYMRHPDWFGGGSPEFDSFYLERMYYDEYLMDAGDGRIVKWQSWPNWWVNEELDAAVDFGCDELARSAKMFGWDGVRWDGHFVGRMDHFKERMAKQIPNFIEGYNIALGDPASSRFLPTLPIKDFHEIAKNHGLMMDESVRDWSNTGFSSGATRPFYDAICREADYEKRIGGLPLFITFDMGSKQDGVYNTLWGLAAGERYTYNTTVGDFNAGPLTRFLTRYSAFIWDDTARLKNPTQVVHVTPGAEPAAADGSLAPAPELGGGFGKGQKVDPVKGKVSSAPPRDALADDADQAKLPAGGKTTSKESLAAVAAVNTAANAQPTAPWFDQSTWLRKLPDGHQQLLVNIVNPPNYTAFCNRVQTPATPLHDVTVQVQIPAGAKVVRTMHLSIDNPDGLSPLAPVAAGGNVSVVLPELRLWSIVIVELASVTDQSLAYPAYELTTPVEDAAKFLADQDKQKALADEQAKKAAAAGIGKDTAPVAAAPPAYLDFAHPRNADLDAEKKVVKPEILSLIRNGTLDVLDVKGMYAWLNPFDDAIGLVGGGNMRSAYANHAGWRVGPDGCMENFPETYRELMSQDVVVLDDVLGMDLGARHRVMLADFVKNGGGMVVLGGCNSISCGMDFNSYIGELLPVKITGAHNTLRDDKGMNFAAEKTDVFGPEIDWSQLQAFTVDISPLKDGVQVLARVGTHPAIVGWTVGKGRIVCILTNTEGDYGDTAKPYWLSGQWTKILADCVKWTSGDYKSVTKIAAVKHAVDPSKTLPMDLLLNAEGMTGDEFTKKLNEALANVADSEGASTLIQAATENSLKIMDKDLLMEVVEEMEPFINDSFAPLAEKMVGLKLDYFRVAGFTLLRYCSSPNSRPLLEQGLKESNPEMVREALAALAHAKDPASIPAIKAYLAAKGKQRLLALTALRLMGDNSDLGQVLTEYMKDFNRVTALTAYRKSVFERLYGGTSFKMTAVERRAAQREFVRAQREERQAIFDVTQFRATLTKFTDAEAAEFTALVAQTTNRAAASISYAALPNFTPEQATRFRKAMADAKLPQLRMLASN